MSPRVSDADEPHIRYVAGGSVDTLEVPDRLMRVRETVGKETTPVIPGKDPGVAPLRPRPGERPYVQDVHHQDVPRLRAVHVDRTAQDVVLI
jgi:hypothetical protein